MKKYIILFILVFCFPVLSQSIFLGGNGTGDVDRVKIPRDTLGVTDANNLPVDVGAGDFTVEFWFKGELADNPEVIGGTDWRFGNVIYDCDRFNQTPTFGISFGDGRVIVGVTPTGAGLRNFATTDTLLDGSWHHLAVTWDFEAGAQDGVTVLYLDGTEAGRDTTDCADCDLSYPNNGTPCSDCCGGGNCNFSDPFIVIGAEKHDVGEDFNGFFTELRISDVIRYTTTFDVETAPFAVDGNTVGLYHFDEGTATTAANAVGTAGTDGTLSVNGGNPSWQTESPFLAVAIQGTIRGTIQ